VPPTECWGALSRIGDAPTALGGADVRAREDKPPAAACDQRQLSVAARMAAAGVGRIWSVQSRWWHRCQQELAWKAATISRLTAASSVSDPRTRALVLETATNGSSELTKSASQHDYRRQQHGCKTSAALQSQPTLGSPHRDRTAVTAPPNRWTHRPG